MRTFDEIRDDFAFLDDWEDRYRYVIELGSDLPPFPENERRDADKVSGCASQVWLRTEAEGGVDPVLRFRGESDAHIVRGLVAVMLALFSGRRASAILDTDAEAAFKSLGLDEHLTSQRANGVRAIARRIRRDAQEALAPAA